ncbi:MAG: hypothetical protein PHO27_00685 [Sulfuricurvum sp.]|nr:hypothetical protein [Sulfuricurvum sp.]
MRNQTLSIIFISLIFGFSANAESYRLSISADTTKFDYAETTTAGLLDTEKADFGNVNGLTIRMEPRYNGIYFDAAFSSGDTNYIGSILHSGNPYGSYRSITKNEIADYTFGYKSTTKLDPYGTWEMPVSVGIGYRRWLRQVGYDELYDWGYYDVGIGLHYAFSPTASLGIDANFRQAFNAQMYENLNGYTYKLQNVHGYKITVPFEYSISSSISTFISYTYDYWSINASNIVGGYYEPNSETKNEILSAGLILKF